MLSEVVPNVSGIALYPLIPVVLWGISRDGRFWRISLATGGRMWQLAKRLWRGEEAATAVEYGLLVGFIAAVIAAAVATLGTTVSNIFTQATEWPCW